MKDFYEYAVHHLLVFRLNEAVYRVIRVDMPGHPERVELGLQGFDTSQQYLITNNGPLFGWLDMISEKHSHLAEKFPSVIMHWPEEMAKARQEGRVPRRRFYILSGPLALLNHTCKIKSGSFKIQHRLLPGRPQNKKTAPKPEGSVLRLNGARSSERIDTKRKLSSTRDNEGDERQEIEKRPRMSGRVLRSSAQSEKEAVALDLPADTHESIAILMQETYQQNVEDGIVYAEKRYNNNTYVRLRNSEVSDPAFLFDAIHQILIHYGTEPKDCLCELHTTER